MKAFTREGKLIELRVGQPTMGMALTEVRLNDTDIFAVVGNPESADWFRCLGTRFVPQDELPVNAQQPDQEPVAWGVLDEDGQIDWTCDYPFSDTPGWPDSVPLYAAPQQRKEWIGLTDEEIEDVCWTEVDQRLRSFTRAIEAKLLEKNK